MTRLSTLHRGRLRLPALTMLLASAAACSDSSSGREAGSAPARAADEAFGSAESRLMEAREVQVDFVVTATGFLEAHLTGRMVLGEGGRARLEAQGTWGGEDASLLLVSNGDRMRLSNGTDTTETATPPELKEALVVGLTRMGVLHNLARLTELAAPDHADGDVRGWVQARNIHRGERGSVDFDVQVDGETTGSAVLFLAPGVELPGERRQTVQFPQGEMRVTEVYGAVSTGAGADPSAFEMH